MKDVIDEQNRPSWLRRCYLWTLSWAEHPRAVHALFLIALIEASIFPVPPDVLLIALALGQPASAFRFAMISTAGSTVGAVVGYGIGMFLFVSVAQPVLELYGAMEKFAEVQGYFVEYGLWFVLVAGFSPIPFKVVTIAAGAFAYSFIPFILAALVSRAARFYLEAALLHWGGPSLREFVERHFEWLTIGVTILVIVGFAGLWLLH